MKQYKFFIAYLSIIFSCFAHASLTSTILPSLSSSDFIDFAQIIKNMMGNNVENSGPENQEDVSVQMLLELDDKEFIERFALLENKLTTIKLNSKNDIAELISLLFKISSKNPKKETPDFANFTKISICILQLIYKYFEDEKQEFLFLFILDSVFIHVSNLGNVGAAAMSDFYYINIVKFRSNNAIFLELFQNIYNEKRSENRKRNTEFIKGDKIYNSRYFDDNILNKPEYLSNIIHTLRSLFEHMLNTGYYFELVKTILHNLSEDEIVTTYPKFYQNSVDLALRLLNTEFRASPTPENERRIREIQTILKKFNVELPDHVILNRTIYSNGWRRL